MSAKEEDFIRFYRDAVIAGHDDPAAETMRHFNLSRDALDRPGCRMPRLLLPGSASSMDDPTFLATLPPHDFSLLAPHLRTIALERGVILQDVGVEIERVYFLHSGMVSLVAVMPSESRWKLQQSGAQARSGPLQVSEQGVLLQERSCSCRARLCGYRSRLSPGHQSKSGHPRPGRALQ
jgi:hypothetical protein